MKEADETGSTVCEEYRESAKEAVERKEQVSECVRIWMCVLQKKAKT